MLPLKHCETCSSIWVKWNWYRSWISTHSVFNELRKHKKVVSFTIFDSSIPGEYNHKCLTCGTLSQSENRKRSLIFLLMPFHIWLSKIFGKFEKTDITFDAGVLEYGLRENYFVRNDNNELIGTTKLMDLLIANIEEYEGV